MLADVRLERRFVKSCRVVAVGKSVVSCKGSELGLLRPESSLCFVVDVVIFVMVSRRRERTKSIPVTVYHQTLFHYRE